MQNIGLLVVVVFLESYFLIISRKFLGVSLILTFFSHVGAIFFLTAHTRDTCQKPGMDRNYSLIVFIGLLVVVVFLESYFL
jgi:hypothetical protein